MTRQDTTEWRYKYEPKTLDEMVLNQRTRQLLEIRFRRPAHMLLYGPPGTGKGTFVNILDAIPANDLFRVNAGLDGKLDFVRKTIFSLAQMAGHKMLGKIFISYNEAEKISVNASIALREIIETTGAVFIFQANNIDKIDPAILSRCNGVIEFFNPDHGQINTFCRRILDQEGATIDRKVLNSITAPVNGHIDMRQVINSLQDYAVPKGV